MEYRLIMDGPDSSFAPGLESAVNEAIAAGWQPLGGPVLLRYHEVPEGAAYPIIMQAMVRPKKSTTDRRLVNALDRRQANPL